MSINLKKSKKVNNSSNLTKDFKDVRTKVLEVGASIIYVFNSQKGGESRLIAPLNYQAMFDTKGRKKTAQEIYSMIETTAHDLGASKYYLE